MLHAAAGRAFIKASGTRREYHPTTFTRLAVLRRRVPAYSESHGGSASSVHSLTRSSPVLSTSCRLPVSPDADGARKKPSPVLSQQQPDDVRDCRDGREPSQVARSMSRPRGKPPARSRVQHPVLPTTINYPDGSPTWNPASSNFGDSPVLPYQDEPPWSEISEVLNDFPESRVGRVEEVWTPLPLLAPPPLPIPESSISFYKNFLSLISSRDPHLLPELLDYHAQFPTFQSTRSFHLLIGRCIREGDFYGARKLLLQMESQMMVENVETRALRARLLIRQGLWRIAWREDSTKWPTIPLPVWLEFCSGIAKRLPKVKLSPQVRNVLASASEAGIDMEDPYSSSFSSDDLRYMNDEDVEEEPVVYSGLKEDAPTRAARYNLLMCNLPVVALGRTTPNVTKVAYCIISLLLRSELQDAAEECTMAYFKSLPRQLDSRTCLRCLDIIHLHLTTSRTLGVAEFRRIQTQVDRMLRAHPYFRANSRTLYFMLGTLRKSRRGGTIAWQAAQDFRARWGSRVVDDRVRARILSYAVKEGRKWIVETVMEEQYDVEVQREMRNAEYEVQGLDGSSAGTHGVKLTMRPSMIMTPSARQADAERISKVFRNAVFRYRKQQRGALTADSNSSAEGDGTEGDGTEGDGSEGDGSEGDMNQR